MAYKKRITKSVVLDSASPNSALDVMIDWIVNKFITDVPDLRIQKTVAYSADGYKKFPVFSKTNYFGSVPPCSKIVFIGKHSNSVGLCIFCYKRGSRYYLDICVLPSFDMMCVTPATFGDGYQNSANACNYISKFLRGYYGTDSNNIQTRLEWDITPSSDTSAVNMSIVYAGGNYGYAYSINSSHTSYNQFQLAFTKQSRSASEPVASMWFMRTTPGIFDIDTQYELTPGTFSPPRYDYYTEGFAQDLLTDVSSLDNINDSVASHVMLLGNNKDFFESVTSGLHLFLLWEPVTARLDEDVSVDIDYQVIRYFVWEKGYLPPVIANYSDKKSDPALWNCGEWFPNPKEGRIFLRRVEQPVTTKDYTYIYRMLIPSMSTPKAGTVYESGSAAYMALLDNSLTYGIKLA